MPQPRDILRQIWGYQDFRPGQEAVIDSVMQGRDTLALFPTGAGKSLCYQVPALSMEGMTLVVSPLIALMKDQVDQLRKRGVLAEAIHAGMPYTQMDRILDNAILGGVKLLYVSPERLHTDLAEARIRQMRIDLVAVDEAHCISQWGYDFRPAYLEIALVREWHPKAPVLALTATAIPAVVEDIQQKLGFSRGQVIRTSFLRPNLGFHAEFRLDKELAMLEWLRQGGGSGIVYVRSRKKTQDLARFLSERGLAAEAFHAGLDHELKNSRQDAWQKGAFPVIVATNAFGMGIDKGDVRTVVHMDLPDSLEAYYQEAGRAGRDGKPSLAVLLAGEPDIVRLEKQLEDSFPPLSFVRQVYRALGSLYQLAYGSGQGESFDFDLADFCQRFDLPILPTMSALRILEESGWLALSESVFQPSLIRFTESQGTIRALQMRSPKADVFIKHLLRHYQGLFQSFVAVQESDIARSLNSNVPEVIGMLEYLQASGFIDYRPRKDKPQLTYMECRVDADNLLFDTELIRFRRKRQEDRLEAIRGYLLRSGCRQEVFMQYFGEEETKPCGICDHCLQGAGKARRSETRVELEDRLKRLLESEPAIPTLRVSSQFSREELPVVRQILQGWSDEGVVREIHGKLYLEA